MKSHVEITTNVPIQSDEIKYEGTWYNVGDSITVKEKIGLFGISVKRKYRVSCIGYDGGATLKRINKFGKIIERDITGNVNIYRYSL